MSENSSSKAVSPLRRFGYALAAIVWVIAVFFIASLVAGLALQVFATIGVPLTALSENVFAFFANALVWAIMLPLLILPLRRWKITDGLAEKLGLQRLLSWSDIGLALVAFIPYLLLSGLLSGLATSFLPGYDVSQTQDVGFSDLSSRVELIFAFIALVIAAPVIEEIIFRGFLFSRLRKHLGLIAGIIFTSLTFAVLHMQLNVGVDVFALSIVLCVLRVVTGSIWAGILLHMTKNALAFFILFVYPMIQ